jgi:hypothetical protein
MSMGEHFNMNKLTTLMFGGALLLGAAGPKQTFTGVITDAMCGANHAMMNVKPDEKCVRECVKAGSKYALLVGGKVYTLSDQQTPAKFAAQKVKVTGALDSKGETIAVDKIEAAK